MSESLFSIISDLLKDRELKLKFQKIFIESEAEQFIIFIQCFKNAESSLKKFQKELFQRSFKEKRSSRFVEQ